MTDRAAPRRVVLDVDTGIDDALALLYAVASPALELCAVTTVAGNVPVEVAARNSAAVLSHAGAADVPVVVGAPRTTTGAGPRSGPTNHGPDGLGGVRVPPGPRPARTSVRDLVAEAAANAAVTLVGLAPLTNVADLAPLAERLVAVAGELVPEDPPEFNAAHDVDATARVLAAGRPTTLYVADVFEQVSVTPADVDRLRSSDRPAARLAGELLAVRRGHLVGDAGALVLLTHPQLFRVEPRPMALAGRALTEVPGGRLLDVVVDVDAASVARAYVDTLLAVR
ncbi:nucleoside hydrolase [Nocardioides xinjiangensis]|uniref:nucleoside hydrolase n=1 Tax=Nocardioides xinjiangensis TaxID=2817376 RepID=UPI001B30527D|nr:nucleoside hydrolase [Nocardioides sp. SYSU D00514]